ncbi:SDR family oxidoreductase [Rhizobium leguminosarum]|uniref:SDR family NAD(P)-dependent oxidoreductase n=1 Tax=Rhizobium leguminosarum TaxID=384 RepID=UPI001C93A489|nr:SDR family oxidoreductase [Rhizobium leguminosarum]MBY5520774.1 SDR family oxidoreductase [Rhizobium leguminosarum]MBY5544256.1 SDR family oxidoreductase [Rhizobium leguminosarum]MBY5570679.1 SDR family oxidoreductase [Rhizobium leguminosarum]MBY5577244.1 SDR family oxidoreductase [Rhizobium leguminosarum]MBY5624951.1 SDR family oxidoreductase [Rhizobium leguminosarum]
MINFPRGTALITGGSSGIGALYADRLARRGYDLILVARSQDALARISRDIASSTGRIVKTVRADLGQRDDLLKVEGILRSDPSITMLVNNAGVGAVEPLLMSDVEAMERMIAINVTAVTRLVYAVAPSFVAREHGTIVNMASALGVAPEILNGVYGATKAFVIALTFSLQKELAEKNIRIQAVLPGAVETPFWEASGGSLDRLPGQIVMKAEDAVDAALAGLDMGELITLPSVPDIGDWNAYEAARQKLMPNLSRNVPAARYRSPALAS